MAANRGKVFRKNCAIKGRSQFACGKTVKYFSVSAPAGGAKAIFSDINLQVTDFVGGGQNHAKLSIYGQYPRAPCRYVPDVAMTKICSVPLSFVPEGEGDKKQILHIGKIYFNIKYINQ